MMNAGVEQFDDFYDLDGNGAAGFYSTVESQINFSGTTFTNVTFRPATSFNVVEHAQNAVYGNVTFDGLEAGQQVTLGSGQHGAQERFYNVNFENVSGGEIRINDYAIVNNLDLHGAECALSVGGRAQLNDLHAEGAHFLRLSAEPGAQIVRGSFDGTTIDMASELSGSIWRNCEFNNATLRDVDLHGAQLTDTHFVGTDLTGVNFAGARLSNCSISGTDIASINAQGAHFHNVSVEVNGRVHTVNSAEQFQALQQAGAIGRSMAASFEGFGLSAPSQNLSIADLGRPLGAEVENTSIAAQQAAGAGASPAEAMPQRGADIGIA